MEPPKPTKPAGVVFKELQEAKLAEQAAREYKWTLAEVEAFNTHWSKADPQTQIDMNQLKPFIQASNERGDFRHPWQMSRDEAKEHFAERGVTGVLWSTAEINAITKDPALSKDYLDEVSRAQREGRLIVGPDVNKGAVYHFAGESFVAGSKEHEAFTRNLNTKLEAIDNRRALERDTQAILEKVDKARESGAFQPGEILHVVQQSIQAVEQDLGSYNSDLYPYTKQPAWGKLQTLAGKLQEEAEYDKLSSYEKTKRNLQADVERGKPRHTGPVPLRTQADIDRAASRSRS
jgi:hypothetical protein